MKHTVIFDLDGTLLDTLDDLTNAVNVALAEAGYPLHTKEEVCSFVGNGIRKLIERAVPAGISAGETDKVFASFRAYYGEHCLDCTKLYPGILATMEELKKRGVRMAIVSNKADEPVKALAHRFFDGLVDTAIGERENNRRKPAPDTVFEALKELGSTAEESIYVGDSEVDLQTGANAGMDVVSVTWGFREREFLISNGATDLIDAPEELLQRL